MSITSTKPMKRRAGLPRDRIIRMNLRRNHLWRQGVNGNQC